MADSAPEWLIEDGIGETRALLIEHGEVLATNLQWAGEIVAGQQYFARLTSKRSGERRGLATLENGQQVMVDNLPPKANEGSTIGIRISRAAIAERGRHKLAQARCFVIDNDLVDPMSKVEMDEISSPLGSGVTVHGFEKGAWEEVWHAASSGTIAFAGGEILCSVTPAMTVIDIDGDAPPSELAIAAIPAIAQALTWFDLGGNIGIDFPTIEAKSERKRIDEALARALADWPHERTAMNGFGFVQLVARLKGPSLLHRFQSSRTGMSARYALRVAERAEGTGQALLLTVHPALKSKLKPAWLEELARRTGKRVRIETNSGLALEAPSAQVVGE